MKNSRFFPQVDLLLRVLPLVAKEDVFAMKGGTAINLFVWDMPRLSVDIDLTYVPVKNRDDSLQEIGMAIARIKQRIENAMKGAKVALLWSGGAQTSFTVEYHQARIKCEVNFVLRGTVFPPESFVLCQRAQAEFGQFVQMNCLSVADLYGGKLCAALDRQHPRDLFDVKMLLDNGGLDDRTRKAFVVYLASHSRPMNELLSPNFKDISATFSRDFEGMTRDPVSLADLVVARDKVLRTLLRKLTNDERRFLVSMKKGNPDWDALGLPGIERLPGLQWKLRNIEKMNPTKRQVALDKLRAVLDIVE